MDIYRRETPTEIDPYPKKEKAVHLDTPEDPIVDQKKVMPVNVEFLYPANPLTFAATQSSGVVTCVSSCAYVDDISFTGLNEKSLEKPKEKQSGPQSNMPSLDKKEVQSQKTSPTSSMQSEIKGVSWDLKVIDEVKDGISKLTWKRLVSDYSHALAKDLDTQLLRDAGYVYNPETFTWRKDMAQAGDFSINIDPKFYYDTSPYSTISSTWSGSTEWTPLIKIDGTNKVKELKQKIAKLKDRVTRLDAGNKEMCERLAKGNAIFENEYKPNFKVTADEFYSKSDKDIALQRLTALLMQKFDWMMSLDASQLDEMQNFDVDVEFDPNAKRYVFRLKDKRNQL